MSFITNEYTFTYHHPKLHQAVLLEAQNEGVDLQKTHCFNDAIYLATKDGQDGVVVTYKRYVDNTILFFIFKIQNDEFISVSSTID